MLELFNAKFGEAFIGKGDKHLVKDIDTYGT